MRTQRMHDNCTLIGAGQERYGGITLSHTVKDATKCRSDAAGGRD